MLFFIPFSVCPYRIFIFAPPRDVCEHKMQIDLFLQCRTN